MHEVLIGKVKDENTMNKHIDRISLDKLLNIGASIGLILYIFCAHFKYPFTSTYFLYISFFMVIVKLFISKMIVVSKRLAMYIAIVSITFLGILYTNNPIEAQRQAIFFFLYIFIFLLSMQNTDFLRVMKKLMAVFAFIGMITVFIQFIIPTIFNLFLAKIIRIDIYQSVMWSFDVDGTFTGITSSVSMASFSMAIVFFEAIRNILDKTPTQSDRREKHLIIAKYINIIIAGIALFGIILTSKRGIFIATIIALMVTCILDKNISVKRVNKYKILGTIILVSLLLILGFYLATTNEYVINFLKRFTGNNITTGRDVFYENAWKDFSSGNIFTCLIGKGTASAYLINKTGLHNVYLQILYDHGIIGLIIYLSFFVINLKNALCNGYFYSICMQIVFLVYCMSGNPLYDYFFFIPYLLYTCYKG